MKRSEKERSGYHASRVSRLTITVNFFPRLMLPLLHGGNLFFRAAGQPTLAKAQRLIFFSVPSSSKICPMTIGARARSRWLMAMAGGPFRDLSNRADSRNGEKYESVDPERVGAGRSSLPGKSERKTIRIEGTGHGWLMRGGRLAPYSAGPRCWITQNTYQFYIGSAEAAGALAVPPYSCVFSRLPTDVYTACSLARKWINVINGHREKVRPVIGSVVGARELRVLARATLIVPFCHRTR